MAPVYDTFRYNLQISGVIEEDFLKSYCPQGTIVEYTGNFTKLLNIQTDQSGVIGIIRGLHNMGCLLVGLQIEPYQEPGI